jgi:hypothetical protein
MIFSHTGLISQAALIQATRQMIGDLLPASASSGALLDHTQVLAALKLALADLDASDPLDVIRAINVQAYLGQTEALIKVSTQHYGAQVLAVYAGQLAEANQLPFDVEADYQVRLHAALHSPDLDANPTFWAIIRWPRSPEPIPISEPPAGPPQFAGVRCVLNGATSDPARPANCDGVALGLGERCLVCQSAEDAMPANGIYQLTQTGLQRAPDASSVSDFSLDKLVCVMQGDTYGDTVWQVSQVPAHVGTSPLRFQLLAYPTNVDVAQAQAHVIPRATAYLAAQMSVRVSDKNLAQQCTEWAATLLARPLPRHAEAISRRAQTATEYAAS